MAENKLSFTGKLVALNNVKEGVSTKDGSPWLFADVIIEEQKEQYPQVGVFSVDIKKYDEIKSTPLGTIVTVHYNLKARENKGTYYGSNAIWKIEKVSTGGAVEQREEKPWENPPSGDLPFAKPNMECDV